MSDQIPDRITQALRGEHGDGQRRIAAEGSAALPRNDRENVVPGDRVRFSRRGRGDREGYVTKWLADTSTGKQRVQVRVDTIGGQKQGTTVLDQVTSEKCELLWRK